MTLGLGVGLGELPCEPVCVVDAEEARDDVKLCVSVEEPVNEGVNPRVGV